MRSELIVNYAFEKIAQTELIDKNTPVVGFDIISNKQWYKDLPKSLKSITDTEFENKSYEMFEDGVDAEQAAEILESDIKSVLDDDIINKYKHIDDINNKIINSQTYSNTYSKSKQRYIAPIIGTGIGGIVGGGLGIIGGKTGMKIGGGIGAAHGALIGSLLGSANDTGNAWEASQKEVAPDYKDIVDSAYKQYKSRR